MSVRVCVCVCCVHLPCSPVVKGAGAAPSSATAAPSRRFTAPPPAPVAAPSSPYRGPARNTSDARGMGVESALELLRTQLKAHGAKCVCVCVCVCDVLSENRGSCVRLCMELFFAFRDGDVQ
ncbi:MAG: hypothetical protein P4L40_26700 [Terracidiphilus sp.]|nr:hypothetical protein [Terracidiphilus sp.]